MTKEILKDEILKAEELGQIAGGNCYETADDSRFLNSLNGSTDRYGEFRIKAQSHDAEIMGAWAALGVTAIIHSGNIFSDGDGNRYYINGQQVTIEQARQHAMDVTGHYMTESDWKW